MKFNWGHGIALAIAIMVGLMLILVVLSSRETIELVTDDYYPKELKYEEQVNKLRNSAALPSPVRIEMKDSLVISFPEDLAKQYAITGEVLFYRPSDKSLDRKALINLNKQFQMMHPLTGFAPGKYEIIIEWTAGDKHYLHKENWFVQE